MRREHADRGELRVDSLLTRVLVCCWLLAFAAVDSFNVTWDSPSTNHHGSMPFIWAGDMTVDQGTDLSLRGRVSGSYEDAWFTFANLNLTYQF